LSAEGLDPAAMAHLLALSRDSVWNPIRNPDCLLRRG